MTKVSRQKNLKPILQNFPRFFVGIWTLLARDRWSSAFFHIFWFTFEHFYGIYILLLNKDTRYQNEYFGGITKKRIWSAISHHLGNVQSIKGLGPLIWREFCY